jgi:hypothetical protein
MTIDPKELKASYEEYARKMDLFMEGPTTTYFQQLIDAGIQLPDPDSVSDTDLRTKLWEVIAGLEKLRVFLEHTNHLDDRGLYTTSGVRRSSEKRRRSTRSGSGRIST